MNPLFAMVVSADTADGVPAAGPTRHLWPIIRTCILVAIVGSFTVWVFIQAFRKSEDPALLLFKWVLTVVLFLFMWFVIGPIVKAGGYAAMGGMLIVMACGWGFAFIWRRSIASAFARPFANLYDGGSTPPEERPYYSVAMAQRKRGYYDDAVATIRKELERFPSDFEGQLLLAEIQAENLNDVPGAEITIQRICNQTDHAQRNIALAWNILADWYLKYYQDRNGAREKLQRIIDQLPDTEMSVLAAQRIASLASTEHLVAQHDRKKFTVVEGVKNLGLLDPRFHPKPADDDAAKQAGELVAHLQSHPLDADARERLAAIYADHYNRLDLATDQLEQLIQHPNQPQKRVIHWLNFLADLQIRHDASYETVRATVQRIIDLYPKSAVADVAANRIAHLKLELKAKGPSQSVKMGTYEQDIGLKMPGGK
jgi:tetratricopeptide (TPR) repeat protein